MNDVLTSAWVERPAIYSCRDITLLFQRFTSIKRLIRPMTREEVNNFAITEWLFD